MLKEDNQSLPHIAISNFNHQPMMQIFIPADSDGSNFDWLNEDEYRNIEYLGKGHYDLKNDGNIQTYHQIQLRNFASLDTFCQTSFQEFLSSALENAHQHLITYEDALKEIMSYFSRETTTSLISMIHEDMAEALLIIHLLDLMDMNTILESQVTLNKKTYYRFNGNLIQPKMTSNQRCELKLSDQDLIITDDTQKDQEEKSNLKPEDLNIFLVQVDYRAHQTNLMNLYDMIQEKVGNLPGFLLDKRMIYSAIAPSYLDNEAIIYPNNRYVIINRRELPEIKILNPKNLISLSYVLDPKLFLNHGLSASEQLKQLLK